MEPKRLCRASVDKKFCGVCGGIIGALALAFHMPDFPAEDYFTAVAVGIMSGLTATGVNQVFKQMKSTNDEEAM